MNIIPSISARTKTLKNINILPLILFISFYVLLLVLYYPTIHSKFTSDFLQWADNYQKMGFSGILYNFGDMSLKYIYHLVTYTLFQLFGFSGWKWFLFFCLVHSLNALVLFLFARKLLQSLEVDTAQPIAIWCSLFFLLSPYQAEVVVWGATAHFLTATLLFLLASYSYTYFLKTKGIKFAIITNLLFFIGMFATEAVIITPVVLLTLHILFLHLNATEVSWKKNLLLIFIPQALFIALFFLVTFITFGNPVGHYGAKTHLNFNLTAIGSCYLKYWIKFVSLYRYLPFDWTNKLIPYYEKPKVVWLFLLLTIIAALYLLYRLKSLSREMKFVVALLFLFSSSLAPVINLETPFLWSMMSDRYGYIPSIFFYILLAFVLYTYASRYKQLLASLTLLLFLACLWTSVKKYEKAGEIFHTLIREFAWADKQHVYILNLADNYDGAYLFRNGLQEALKFKYGKDIREKIHIITWYNMNDADGSIKITPKGNNTFYSIVSHWGTWFWYTQSRENENYKLDLSPSNFEYLIHFKNLSADDIIIYQSGKHWRVLK